ncbi:MAG: septum formation family protein [Mycobacteriaceae bacterium]|nr:septum formation family protein [Mycobacteriaceae bacterium]
MTYPPGQPHQYEPYQPQPYGVYGQQPPPYPPPRKSTNRFAIASLILGVLGVVLLSIIFGILGLVQTKGGRQAGRGLAIAGLVVSGVWIVLGIVAVVLIVIFANRTVLATDVQLGDCIETTPADMASVRTLPKVSCDKPHEGEVFALIPVSGDTFPGQDALRDEYEKKCVSELDNYSSKAASDSAYQIFVLYPTQETWDQGDRRVACLTITQDKRTGSVRGG